MQYRRWYTDNDTHRLREIGTQDIIVLDVETTGFEEWDEILQLAIIDGHGNALMNELFRPSHNSSWPEAQSVNGISPRMVRDKPRIEGSVRKINQVLNRADLIIGYNLDFDLGFLDRIGIHPRSDALLFDVMVEFAPVEGWWKKAKHDWGWISLERCSRHYGISYKPHDAFEDSHATLECYRAMLADDSDNGYLALCRHCAGRSPEAWREVKDLQKLQQERKKADRVRREYGGEPRFDQIDDSIYECFLAGGINDMDVLGPSSFEDERRMVREATVEAISRACKAHGGRLYKSKAKSAKWAVISSASKCTYGETKKLSEQGYKVTRLPDFLEYLGVDEGWDLDLWKRRVEEQRDNDIRLYSDDPAAVQKAKLRYRQRLARSWDENEEAWERKHAIEVKEGTRFDSADDSVISCFIYEYGYGDWSPEASFCTAKTLERISVRCSELGGSLYKNQAKEAEWAVISWPRNCAYETVRVLRSRGYKVIRLPELLAQLGMGDECDACAWEAQLAKEEGERRKLGNPYSNENRPPHYQAGSTYLAELEMMCAGDDKAATYVQEGNLSDAAADALRGESSYASGASSNQNVMLAPVENQKERGTSLLGPIGIACLLVVAAIVVFLIAISNGCQAMG